MIETRLSGAALDLALSLEIRNEHSMAAANRTKSKPSQKGSMSLAAGSGMLSLIFAKQL